MTNEKYILTFKAWQKDWNLFVRDVLKARLDAEQQAIITSVQTNPMTAVASGTARGKDFVAACASLCFLYLTPKFSKDGRLIENTKVAMTAPTGRQVLNIMVPEVRRLFRNAGTLPGRLVAGDIRTNYEEWFLTGFKAGDDATEAWSGFHASNTMFVVTEASGISETTFNAIEGNLQGNSRLLIVFNPNNPTGYAANAMRSGRFHKFRLNSLNAENVTKKQTVIPGQVDYEWVKDKVENWCEIIQESDFIEDEGDFNFEGIFYRPNDLFRIKVLGMFPKESESTLVPLHWIEAAEERYLENNPSHHDLIQGKLDLGVDVAGMGRDSSILCYRKDSTVFKFRGHHSGGKADHMHVSGMVAAEIGKNWQRRAYIDTIGEGAGVYSRLQELGHQNAYSCKFSEGAGGLKDVTGIYEFENMRAYLFWSIRDWLNPRNKNNAMLVPTPLLKEELTNIKWEFSSNGKVKIEPKDKIKERLKRSPDYADSLANTFYPNNIHSSGLSAYQLSQII